MRTYKIIKVEWGDCQVRDGWQDPIVFANMGEASIISAGIQVPAKRGNIALTVALATDDGMINSTIVIPKRMIHSMRVLETFRV